MNGNDYYDDCLASAFRKTMFLMLGGTAIVFGLTLKKIELKKAYLEERKVSNNILISDNEFYRNDGVYNQEPCNDKYEVVYQDDQTLAISVYGDSPAERYMYTEFLEHNITINENGEGTYTISFDEENLTDDNYAEFVAQFYEEHQSEGVQRKRA